MAKWHQAQNSESPIPSWLNFGILVLSVICRKAHTFGIFTLEAEAAFLFAGPAAFCNILMFACTRNSFVLRTGQATFTADTLC